MASRTGSSEGVSLLRAPAGASGPSVLVASHGTSEARRGPFPVCGLCLSNAALSFPVQRGFPPSLPITEISRRPTLSLTKPRTAGGRALPCTLWLGLVLSSFQEQEGHVFLLFFFFSSINGDGVFVWRNRWCPLCSVASGCSMVRVGHGGRPGGRVGLVLRKFSKLWLCDFRPFHWALDAFWSIGDEGQG